MADQTESMVTISCIEHARLLKAAYQLEAFKDCYLVKDKELNIRECAHPGCKACAVNDGYRNPDVEYGCEYLIMCDYQLTCEGLYYCDAHVNLYASTPYDEEKHSLWVCKNCQAQVDKTDAIKHQVDVDGLPQKDIDLVMLHAPGSSQEATNALLKHNGDIVLAIMEIQNAE